MKIPFSDRVNFCKSCEQYKDCVQPYNEECGVLHSIIDSILSEDAKQRQREELDKRPSFECAFCSQRCPDIPSCNHRYDVFKCKDL